ncbi:MAG: polysaccharide biosynthesis/export family protein [Planctomycetaceae bacterium]
MRFSKSHNHSLPFLALSVVATMAISGCYAPLTSPGIAARDLPEEFRFPVRSNRNRLNLAELTIPQRAGQVGPGDLLSVHVHGLSEEPTSEPLQVRVLEDGTIDLPLIGSVSVAGRTLPRVRDELVRAYKRGKFLESAQVSVQMIEVATVQVVVIGEVQTPGVYTMPRNQADVGRALALAGGMTDFAGESVEVHSNSQSLFNSHAANLNSPSYISPAPSDYVDEDDSSSGAGLQRPPVPPRPDSEDRSLEGPDDDAADELESLDIPEVRRSSTSWIQQVSYEPESDELSFEEMFGGHSIPSAKPKRRRPRRREPAPVVQAVGTNLTAGDAIRPTNGILSTTVAKHFLPTSRAAQNKTTVTAIPLLRSRPEAPEPSAPEPGFRYASEPHQEPIAPQPEAFSMGEPVHTCIPLVGSDVRPLSPEEVRLHDGDVLTVPRMTDDVFYIVGPLNNTNRTSFNVGNRDLREIGTGFIIPRNRDIDVITGVAMAGYIDPINSPTTVSVHRRLEDGRSLLIKVNLIEARYDRRETVMLRPGDIVYLNPDAAWWSRRYFDQVAPDLFRLPWRFWTQNWILGSSRSSAL